MRGELREKLSRTTVGWESVELIMRRRFAVRWESGYTYVRAMECESGVMID